MLVDGERVDSDVAPITTASERAFVPLRSIADALGAETEVDAKNGAIDVVLGGQSLRVRVGDHARDAQRHAVYARASRPFAFADAS